MVRRNTWGLLVGLVLLGLAPAAGLAASEGFEVEAPQGGMVVDFVNRLPTWAPMPFLSRATGTGLHDGDVITVRSETSALSHRWSLFTDRTQHLRLKDGLLTLVNLRSAPGLHPAIGPGTVLALSGHPPYDLSIQVIPGSDPIPPGTYQGELTLGEGAESKVIPVTVQVRDAVWIAILVTLAGLLANWAMNRFRVQRDLLPEIIRHRRLVGLIRENEKTTPKLIRQLADWARLNLHRGTPEGKALASKELFCAELLMTPVTYPTWVVKLNDLDEAKPWTWQFLQQSIEELSTETPTATDLHAAVHAQVQKHGLLADFPGPGDMREGLDDSHIKTPNKSDHLSWHAGIRLYLSEWAFAGSALAGVWIVQTGIFIGACGATIVATIAIYKEIPTFGSDVLTHYGAAFLVGYGGKSFNDFLQRFAPGIASGVTVHPEVDAQKQASQPSAKDQA